MIIPKQTAGQSTDAVSKVKLEKVEEALCHFEIVKDRLLDVSHWHELSGDHLAEFQLADASGKSLCRKARKGDYLSIKIPGPGNKTGQGYDWVRVENVEYAGSETLSYQFVAIKVRPCESPLNYEKSTAHFFKNMATSTFIVKRDYNVISAEVHGRNEQPNIESLTIFERVRNAIVAVGAMLGFSKIQWKSLVNGLVAINH